jgi:hypothetical protein
MVDGFKYLSMVSERERGEREREREVEKEKKWRVTWLVK